MLLFCTFPCKEYRENLHTVFVHEAGRLDVVQVASEKTMSETLNVKKWTDVQLHTALMRVQDEAGIFVTCSLIDDLAARTSVFEGLKQVKPWLSVSHNSNQRLCLCIKLRLLYCTAHE